MKESRVTPVSVDERVAYHRKLIEFNGESEGNRVKFMIDTGSEIDVCLQHIYAQFENMVLSGVTLMST